MADYIAVHGIDGEKDGKRHEYAPGDPITVTDDDERKLLAAGAIREPSEAETALIEKRARSASQRTASPVKMQTEPPKANGPGGASGETDNRGDGSVATDTNTVGAGEQGNEDSSQPQGTTVKKTDGSKDKPAAKGKAKRNDADLA